MHLEGLELTKLTYSRHENIYVPEIFLLWYGLGRPLITSEIGNWSVFVILGWRFVFGIIMKRDGREPTSSDAITTLGIIKLLLSYMF